MNATGLDYMDGFLNTRGIDDPSCHGVEDARAIPTHRFIVQRYILPVLLIVLCLATVAVGTISPQEAYGAGMQDPDVAWYTADPGKSRYTLTTPAQLRGLAELVNGTAQDPAVAGQAVDFRDVTIVQGADFSLYELMTAVEFTPIGTEEHPFAGKYDGNGKSIQGLHITKTLQNAGLFGYADEHSTIVGVTIESSVLAKSVITLSPNTEIVKNIGSLVGKTDGTVIACSSGAVLTVASTTKATTAVPFVVQNVGGLVGYSTGDIEGCSFAGSLTASIATNAAVSSTATEDLRVADSFGGVVGHFGSPTRYGTLSASHNTGTIWVYATGKGSSDRFGTDTFARPFFIAGVCGYSNGSVVDCYNGTYYDLANTTTGTVSTSAIDVANGAALDNRGGDQVAGVVGGLRSISDSPDRYNDGDPAHLVEVRNCFNKGKVTGCVSVGGVVAEAGCYTTITQCYNGIPSLDKPGHVMSTRWNKPISGGVAGRIWGGVISYSANYGIVENIQTGYYMAGVCGAIWKSDDYPALLPELYSCLNTGNVLTANRSTSSEYREAGILGSNEGYAYDSIMLEGTVPYHSDAAIGDINWGKHSNLEVMKQGQLQTAASAALLNKTAAAQQNWDCYWFINAVGYPILNVWAGASDYVTLTSETIESVEMTKEAPYIGAGAEPIAEFSISLANGTKLVQNTDFYVVPEPGASAMSGGEKRYTASIVGIGMYRGTVENCAPYAIGKGDLALATVDVSEEQYSFGKVVFPTSVGAYIGGHALSPDEYTYIIYDSTTGDVSGSRSGFAAYDSAGYVSYDNGANVVPVSGVDLNKEMRPYTLYDRTYQKISDSEGRIFYVDGAGGVVGEPIAGHESCISLKRGTPAGYTVQVIAKSDSVLLEGSTFGYYIIKTVSLYQDCVIDWVKCQDGTWYWDQEAAVLYEKDGAGVRLDGMPAAVFTGETIIPTPQVSFGETLLEIDKDFRVVAGDPDPAQDAEDLEDAEDSQEKALNRDVTNDKVRAALTIRPVDTNNIGNYVIAYFGIEPAAFEDCDISLAATEWAYTGQAVTPKVSVKLNGIELIEGTDYDVAYADNLDKGTARYTVTPKANLSGGSLAPYSGDFRIVDGMDISQLTVGAIADQQFNFGYDVNPTLSFKNGATSLALKKGADYTVEYSTFNITKPATGNPGTPCTATIKGIGKYTGQLKTTFHIVAFDAARNTNDQLVATVQDMPYGTWMSGIKGVGTNCPVVNVLAYPIIDWDTLEKGSPRVISSTINASWGGITQCEYRDAAGKVVTYETAEPGPLTAVITLTVGSTATKGGAIGALEAQASYTAPADIATTVDWKIGDDRTYDGTPKQPVYGVTKGGLDLVEGIHYTIAYSTNTAAGSASYTVNAVSGGYFIGTHSGTFSILPASLVVDESIKIEPIEDQVFKGEALEPAITVMRAGVKLVRDVDYRVAYVNNDALGTATVYAEGKGNYSGRISATFEIVKTKVSTIAGETRVETAVAAAQTAYPQGCSGVILAHAQGYADALSAASLAGALDYPILLTDTDELNASTAQAIRDLGAREIIIVGGTPSISDDVRRSAEAIIGKSSTRLAGETRIGTQEEIYRYGKERNYWMGQPIIATGYNFPDALSISAYAAKTRSPIFLVQDDDTFSTFGQTVLREDYAGVRAIIVGGASTIPMHTEYWLADALGTVPLRLAGNVDNNYGDHRYGTSAAIAVFCLQQGMSIDNIGFATGENYPDALSGGPAQAKDNAIVVLVDDTENGRAAVSALASMAQNPVSGTDSVRFFGQDTGYLKAEFRKEVLSILLG